MQDTDEDMIKIPKSVVDFSRESTMSNKHVLIELRAQEPITPWAAFVLNISL